MTIEVQERESGNPNTRRFIIIPFSGGNRYHEIKKDIADRMEESEALKGHLRNMAIDLLTDIIEINIDLNK